MPGSKPGRYGGVIGSKGNCDAVETHETLCWWNIDETSLIEGYEHQLVHVIKS